MALTKVITGVTDLNQAQSTNGLKFPTGDVFAGTPEEGMIRNDQSQASEGSASTMQFYNGTAWKNFVNRDPTPLGSDNFNTVLYTGNSSTQAITGVGFAPDFVWIKRRNSAEDHALYDSVRGINKQLSSNTTAVEATNSSPYEGLNSFDSDGFTSGNNGGTNRSPNTYVAWNWKAGGTAVSNTDGTITSSVSANTAAGFSIVKWSGNDLASQTIGHGLSSTPELYIIKKTSATLGWQVNLSSSVTGTEGYLLLDRDQSMFTTFPNYYTSANSTVLSTNGTSTAERVYNNQSTGYIAYCWHSVAGYSKIGSYTGNGSATGPIVTTDFEPAFVMVKNTTGTGLWLMSDNKRQVAATKTTYLQAQSNAAEYSPYTWIEYLNNGFQLKNNGSSLNTNGSTYVYMAFAAT